MAGLVRHRPLLILDFDETLVDVDSSEWVAEQLGVKPLFDALRWEQGMAWHHAMNTVLHTIHSQGISIPHIREAVCSLPLPAETVCALKHAHSLGCELRVISDANTFFIETALAHHGVLTLFTQIHSNPAWIDATGCLHYDDFHGHALPPHRCPLCPPNMCKGSILHSIRAVVPQPAMPQVIYAGDGAGDVCPSLRLNEHDYVLPRQGYTLWKLLDEYQIKARVRPWTTLATTLHDSLLECVASSDEDLVPNLTDVSGSTTDSVETPSDEVHKCSALGYKRERRITSFTEPTTSSCSHWRRPFVTSQRNPHAIHATIHIAHGRYSSTLLRPFAVLKRVKTFDRYQGAPYRMGHGCWSVTLPDSVCSSGVS